MHRVHLALLTLASSMVLAPAARADDLDRTIAEADRRVKRAAPVCVDGDSQACAVVCADFEYAGEWLYEWSTDHWVDPHPRSDGNILMTRRAFGLAACDTACDAGILESCYEGAQNVYEDPVREATFQMKACNKGASHGCANAIELADQGHVPGHTGLTLIQLLVERCDFGDQVACYRLGSHAFVNWKKTQDPKHLAFAVDDWTGVCNSVPQTGEDAATGDARIRACRYALCVTGRGRLLDDVLGDPQEYACVVERMTSARNVAANLALPDPEPRSGPSRPVSRLYPGACTVKGRWATGQSDGWFVAQDRDVRYDGDRVLGESIEWLDKAGVRSSGERFLDYDDQRRIVLDRTIRDGELVALEAHTFGAPVPDEGVWSPEFGFPPSAGLDATLVSHDATGRPFAKTVVTYFDGARAFEKRSTYDAFGNEIKDGRTNSVDAAGTLTGFSDAGGTMTFVRDSGGRILEKRWADVQPNRSWVRVYTYDTFGNPLTMTLYSHSVGGEGAAITISADAAPNYTEHYSYECFDG